MSNKSRLETNNTNLQSILSTVQGLPNVDAVKHGKYVWKKCLPEITVTDPYIVADITSSNITIKSASFELSYINENNYKIFFDGFSQDTTRRFALSSGQLLWYATDTSKNPVTAYSNGVFDVMVIYNRSTDVRISYAGSKVLRAKTLVDYVVSDVANAYPDGGLKDGYWYEKMAGGQSGVDVVFFTPTEDTLSATVTHTLGKMPSNVAVCRVKGSSSDYSANHVLCAADTAVSAYNSSKYYGAAYSYSSASGITANEFSFTENLISYASSYYRLEAGVTYAFIAIG